MAEVAKEKVSFPVDEDDWHKIKPILEELAKTDNEVDTIYGKLTDLYNIKNEQKAKPVVAKDIYQTQFGGLKSFYDRFASKEDQELFTSKAIPCIAKLALEAGELRPKEGLMYSKQQDPLHLQLSRRFVASIVATGFLCLFRSVDNEKLPSVSFEMFFAGAGGKSQRAKLQMILNYFNRVGDMKDGPLGQMAFTRIVLDGDNLLSEGQLQTCDLPLVPFVVGSR